MYIHMYIRLPDWGRADFFRQKTKAKWEPRYVKLPFGHSWLAFGGLGFRTNIVSACRRPFSSESGV